MFCKNCGKELPENAKFCSGCGTPVVTTASPEPQDPPISQEFPVIPAEPEVYSDETVIPDFGAVEPPVLEDPAAFTGAPVLEDPAAPAARGASVAVDPAITTAQEGGDPGTSPVKRRGKIGFVVIGVAAVVVIVLLALAIKAGMSLLGGGGGGGVAAYAYLNDDNELMYLADLKEKTVALELTDEGGYYSSVYFSPDGKTVYFTDEDSALYSITVAELKKGGKPERVSRDVSDFYVLKDGRLVYTQYSNGELRLNIYENGESFRLLKSCSNYRFSEDQKTIYYTERDESDGTTALYKIAITKDAKGERLLKGATTIYSSYDADILVYGVDDNAGGNYSTPSGGYADNNTLAVYSCKPGGDKTKLVDDVYSVAGVNVDGGKVSFYYWVEDVEERTLYDFVTDTNAGADATVLAGEEPEYPYWYDFSVDEIWIDDEAETYSPGMVYYTNGKGEECPIDVSGLLSEGYTVADLYGMYGEIYNIAYDDAQERYNAASDDYNARYDIWSAAENREYIRQNLKENQYNQTSYSLYHYTGSDKSEPIATGVHGSSRIGSALDGVFLYHKVVEAGGKVVDVADLSYAGEIYDYFQSGGSEDEDWYQNVGGKESVLKNLDDVTRIYGVYVLNGKEVVLDVYDGDEKSLRAYSLGKDSLTFTSTIIEGDDFFGPYWGETSGKDVLYLFADTEEEEDYRTVGDFSVYKDGKLETIAKEVYGAVILDESGTTYVVTDVDTRNNSAELAVMKDGKPVTISDEVGGAEPIFLDNTQLLYISDGDLMLWNGKEERQIARDVVRFWSGMQESYSTYSPN